ncbi:hypothetical protein DPSP01_000192 [Paraphaeosphaeria sporulosa]|uniref:DUF202 domain-containing protein n=1 Tax=Paraphaeosphaeria sporulosa TaxID=1460663 RepID=A0A177D008_9PLEO|nr:uncharacterized protein CC84DRAFT_163222 [Paraphaeosphaeria sporulosa]OAG12876.1 hypothetical protein CC84DRAFT_163222 [Paraphaeosphaeria sporulosa]
MDFRPLDRMLDTDESITDEPFRPFYNFWAPKPVIVHQDNEYDGAVFIERPWLGVLLFDNIASDARDHAANERTFLSWLRLSVYMAIVAVAIILNFHLKSEPTAVERRISLPFGIIFWILSVACLVSGLANYIKTVARYSRRAALVQAGWKTQAMFTVVATTIVAACILFLSTNAQNRR